MICGLLFGAKGDAVYHSVTNILKATAPVTQPLVESLLAAKGLPTTPNSALQVLTEAAASALPLPQSDAEGLAGLIGQYIPLVPPAG